MNGRLVSAIWREATERAECEGGRITLPMLRDIARDLRMLGRNSPSLMEKVLTGEMDLVDAVVRMSGPL